MTVTRETLYEEVWVESMVVVAARYDVSGNFLARVCRALNVPHPARGYWTKAKAGKASRQPELPPVTAGYATEWTRGTMPVAVVGPHRIPPAGTRRRRWSRPTWHSLLENATPLFERARTSNSGSLWPLKRAFPDIAAAWGYQPARQTSKPDRRGPRRKAGAAIHPRVFPPCVRVVGISSDNLSRRRM